MAITVSLSQSYEMIVRAIKAQLVPLVVGSPACGKSSIVRKVARDFNLFLIDLRLPQCDPTDLLGFPYINKETNRSTYLPMEYFPLEGDEIPKGYSGWLIFFDEITGAPESVQKAAYKPILDRMVGNKNIHKNVVMVAAGNLETDNAFVEPMSTALQSRLIHMEIKLNAEDWLKWAAESDIDHRIMSFIRFKPSCLYTFDANHTDKTYASPRTWEFASKMVKGMAVGAADVPILSGTVSEGVAREFIAFCQIYTRLPNMQQIIDAPDVIEVPREPSILYALSGALGNNANEGNIDKLMKFVNRMPVEFQVITLRDFIRRTPTLLQAASVQNWVAVNSAEFF